MCCAHCGKELPKSRGVLCFACESEISWSKPMREEVENRIKQGMRIPQVSGVRTLFIFEKEGVEQSVIHQLKYRNSKQTGRYFGELLGTSVLNEETYEPVECIIPVPVFHRKRFDRGYNQAEEISRGLSSALKVPVKKLVSKKKHTGSQTKLTREERIVNVQGSFSVSSEISSYGSIALVDDVITTGSTLKEICHEMTAMKSELNIVILSLGVAKFH